MKKIRMFVCLLLASVIMVSYPVQAAGISTYAWPGRPGGNGDGSEEWLQGNYGETNGPYKLVASKSGHISELYEDTLAEGIVKAVISLDPNYSLVMTVLGVGQMIKSKQYEGSYYKSDSYISGRRMKVVIKTYDDASFKKYMNTYTDYIVW